MKAAVIKKGATAPAYEDFPDSEPGKDEIVLTVTAASLKQIDRLMVSGEHYASAKQVYPFISGVDGVGKGRDGKRYYFANLPAPYGAMAEKVAVNPAWIFPLPEGIDDATAAALPNPAISSWAPLSLRTDVNDSTSALVIGAVGTAGRLAVQILKHLGARGVVGLGRGKEMDKFLKAHGIDSYIDLKDGDDKVMKLLKNHGPFDIVLDYLWGKPAELYFKASTGDSFESAGIVTRYVQIGDITGTNVSLPAESLRSSGLEIIGSGGGSVSQEQLFQTITEAIPKLFELAANGRMQIETESVPLKDVAEVWTRKTKSRIVFIP